MIPNCEGCEVELEMAIEYQDEEGLHFANTKERVGIGERKHLGIIMVDDEGVVMVS